MEKACNRAVERLEETLSGLPLLQGEAAVDANFVAEQSNGQLLASSQDMVKFDVIYEWGDACGMCER